MRAAPKIGPSNASLEQSVACNEALRPARFHVCPHPRRTILSADSVTYNKTNAARRVSWSVENPSFVPAPA